MDQTTDSSVRQILANNLQIIRAQESPETDNAANQPMFVLQKGKTSAIRAPVVVVCSQCCPLQEMERNGRRCLKPLRRKEIVGQGIKRMYWKREPGNPLEEWQGKWSQQGSQ